MLADIADQKHSVMGTKPRKELAHLVGTGKARFINKEKPLLFWIMFPVLSTGEETLQGSGLDTGLIQLARSAGGRRKTLDLIPLPFSSATDDRERRCFARASEALDYLDVVRRTEHILDHAPLCPVEMLVMIGNGDGLRTGKNWLDVVLSLTHPP